MRGTGHSGEPAQRERAPAVRNVTTNEISAAETPRVYGAEAAGAFHPPAPAAIYAVPVSRIGAAETARRVQTIQRHQASPDYSWKEIGRELGMSADRIWRWWNNQQARARGEKLPHTRVHRQKGDVQLKPGQTRRLCMTCQKPFASDGAHNRLCHDHRLAGDGSPYMPDPGGDTGRRVGARRK